MSIDVIKAGLNDIQTNIDTSFGKLKGQIEETEIKQRELADEIMQLKQRGISMPMESFGASSNPADLIAKAIYAEADSLRKNRQCAFEVKSFVGSAAVGTTGNLDGIAAPTGVHHGIGTVLALKPITSMASLKYTRENIALSTGGAGVQAGEGEAKPWYQPGFQQITQEPLTIAALTKLSEQAIRNQSELTSAVEALIRRDIALTIDQKMLLGNTTPAWPGLVALATEEESLSFDNTGDAIQECGISMELLGSKPTAVMMSGSEWLRVALDQDALGRSAGYERYLKEIERRIGPMKVGLTTNLTGDQSLLIDPTFVEIFVSQNVNVQMAFVEDDFEKNLISLRVECEIIPVLRSTRGIRISKPKPA